ncbi:MAG: hypothetical protein ACI4MJ_07610 [Aristaeellaceae bacterium]
MGKQLTRAALPGDAFSMAGVKSRYMRALYRGYLPERILKQLHETYYLTQVQGWFHEGWSMEVLETDGAVSGYVVYGADPEEAGCGLILEAAILPIAGGMDKALLMNAAMRKLTAQYPRIHFWTMRDNFRARFLFDHYGFRLDGKERTISQDGEVLTIIRMTCVTSEYTE